MPESRLVPVTGFSFRCAQELASSEPAQLKRTIEELEARIREQDTLIIQKDLYIEDLAQKLEDRDKLLQEIDQSGSESDLSTTPAVLKLKAKIDRLERENLLMEGQIADFEEGFTSIFRALQERLKEHLEMLEKMPAAPETRSICARVRRESRAILAGRDLHKMTPIMALKLLAELEGPIIKFVLGRPALTFTILEVYRAEMLLENLAMTKARYLTGSEAAKILSERETKKIYRVQASRAMHRAAALHPDGVKIEKRRGGLRLVKREG